MGLFATLLIAGIEKRFRACPSLTESLYFLSLTAT